jgi:hypothetical protein
VSDAFACGRHEHDAWKRGAEHITRWLGPYDANMPLADVHARFEHDKLTQAFRDGYERGWRSLLPEGVS